MGRCPPYRSRVAECFLDDAAFHLCRGIGRLRRLELPFSSRLFPEFRKERLPYKTTKVLYCLYHIYKERPGLQWGILTCIVAGIFSRWSLRPPLAELFELSAAELKAFITSCARCSLNGRGDSCSLPGMMLPLAISPRRRQEVSRIGASIWSSAVFAPAYTVRTRFLLHSCF